MRRFAGLVGGARMAPCAGHGSPSSRGSSPCQPTWAALPRPDRAPARPQVISCVAPGSTGEAHTGAGRVGHDLDVAAVRVVLAEHQTSCPAADPAEPQVLSMKTPSRSRAANSGNAQNWRRAVHRASSSNWPWPAHRRTSRCARNSSPDDRAQRVSGAGLVERAHAANVMVRGPGTVAR